SLTGNLFAGCGISNLMRRSFLVACLAAFAASSTIPARADIQWLHSWDQAQQLARKTGKPIFVDMVTDWCVWCKRMDTYVYPTRT
ncbi:thioredoxin family protein, partial [Acinetobacter baumannii]